MAAQAPLTRLTLIGSLRQGLRWEEFIALYGRLILLWGRRDFGLQDSDAKDLCQDVLIKVWKGIQSYDPARGRFRNWLYACTRNTALNLRRDRHREWIGDDRPDVVELLGQRSAPPPAWDDACELEEVLAAVEEEGFDRDGLQEAVLTVRSRVQPLTWKAFLLFEFFDLSAREVGARLGMKPTAVGQAVYRVRQLLNQAWLAETTFKEQHS
jgi:RNA polymerase sigma-70 factor (ECF subfamily)